MNGFVMIIIFKAFFIHSWTIFDSVVFKNFCRDWNLTFPAEHFQRFNCYVVVSKFFYDNYVIETFDQTSFIRLYGRDTSCKHCLFILLT